MTLKQTHLHLMSLNLLRDLALGALLKEACEEFGGPKHLPVKWRSRDTEPYLKLGPLPRTGGDVYLTLKLKDFSARTLTETLHDLEAILAAPFDDIRTNQLGRMIERKEHDVRRIRKRSMRVTGLLRRARYACRPRLGCTPAPEGQG